MQKQINNIKNNFKSLKTNFKKDGYTTDLNISISFILTLVGIFLCFNRFLESLIILFTGCATSYFSTLTHLLSLSIITIAYFTAIESKNVKYKINDNTKLNIFHFYSWMFIVYFVSMTVEIVNKSMIQVYFYENNLLKNIYLLKPALIAMTITIMYFMYLGIYTLYKKYVILNRKNIYNLVHAKGISFNKQIEVKETNANIVSDKSIYYFGDNNLLTFETKDLLKHLIVFGNNDLKYKYVFKPLFILQAKRRQNYLIKEKAVLNDLIKENICIVKPQYIESDDLRFYMVEPTKGKEDEFKKRTIDITTIDGLTQKSIGLIYVSEEYNNFKDLVSSFDFNENINVVGIESKNARINKNIKLKGLNPLAYDNVYEVKYNTINLIKEILKSNNQALNYQETNEFLENVITLLYLTYPRAEKNDYPDIKQLLSLLQNLNFLKILNTELKDIFLDKQIFLSKEELEIYQNTYLYFENNVFKSNVADDDESLQQKIFRDILTITKLINSFLSNKDVCNIFLNKDKSIDFKYIFEKSSIAFVYIDKENRTLSNTMYRYINTLLENATKDRIKQKMSNTQYIYFEDFSNILYSDNFNIDLLNTYTENTVAGIFGLKDANSNQITNNYSAFLQEIDSGIQIVNKNINQKELLEILNILKVDASKNLDLKNRSDFFAIYNIISKGKRIKGFEDLEGKTTKKAATKSKSKISNTNIKKEYKEENKENIKYKKEQVKEKTDTSNLSDNIAVLLNDIEEDEFKKMYKKNNRKKRNYTSKSKKKNTNIKNTKTAKSQKNNK